MKRRRVALSYELSEISDAIEAARLLGDAVCTHQLGTEHDRRTAPRALTAVLNLVGARLKDVARIVRGDLDPAAIYSHFNRTESNAADDIVLHVDGKNRTAG